MRILIGGALAAALGGASAAWACSPTAGIEVRDGVGNPLTASLDQNPTVIVSASYPITTAPVGSTVVIASDATVLASAPVTGSERLTVTYSERLTVPGTYYFTSYAEDADREVIQSSVRTAAYILTPAAQTTTTPDAGTPAPQPEATLGNTSPENATSPDSNTANPAPGTETVTGTPAPAPVAQQPVAPPGVSRPAPSRPATNAPAAAGAPASQRSVAPSPTDAGSPAAAPAPAGAIPAGEPTSAPARQFLAPDARELWSGLDTTGAGPGLDAPLTTQKDDGFPVGAGLLGIGVVALAGVGLVAGQRRLALARRPRS